MGESKTHNTDVFIIGGGPAGLATAIALRMKGFKVTVADGARFPIDKACGEGLMPDAVSALQALGVDVTAESGVAFRGIRFIDRDSRAAASFTCGTGLGIRRSVLHRMLAERASQLGATIRWQSLVDRVRPGSVEVGGSSIPCRWIVGADGQASRVRQWAGLDSHRYDGFRFGFRRHFHVEPWTDFVEVHWNTSCQFFITPVGSSTVSVALLSRDPRLRIERALERFPELQQRLSGARMSPERGAISAMRGLKRLALDPYILVGDAAGSVDAVTGEGLATAFQSAVALADALACDDLASYQAAHRRIESRPASMARLLLMLDRHPALRRHAMRALAGIPGLFSWILDAHVRQRPALALPACAHVAAQIDVEAASCRQTVTG